MGNDTILTTGEIQAFAAFLEIVDAKQCSRNLRQMFFEFLKIEDSPQQDYFPDLVTDMQAIHDLLEVIEDRQLPT